MNKHELLLEVFYRCAIDNWDGYSAKAVSLKTALVARELLLKLPDSEIDIHADPDGDIIFEWYKKPGWVFTMAINSERRIAYSGLFGNDRIRGIFTFEDIVPDFILQSILR